MIRMLLIKGEPDMSKKTFKIVVYIMLFAMVGSSLLALLEPLLFR